MPCAFQTGFTLRAYVPIIDILTQYITLRFIGKEGLTSLKKEDSAIGLSYVKVAREREGICYTQFYMYDNLTKLTRDRCMHPYRATLSHRASCIRFEFVAKVAECLNFQSKILWAIGALYSNVISTGIYR